jgi:hypothetical protein
MNERILTISDDKNSICVKIRYSDVIYMLMARSMPYQTTLDIGNNASQYGEAS